MYTSFDEQFSFTTREACERYERAITCWYDWKNEQNSHINEATIDEYWGFQKGFSRAISIFFANPQYCSPTEPGHRRGDGMDINWWEYAESFRRFADILEGKGPEGRFPKKFI